MDTQIKQLHSFLTNLCTWMTKAERMGTIADYPEGSRYIQFSDTLALRIANTANQYTLLLEEKFAEEKTEEESDGSS